MLNAEVKTIVASIGGKRPFIEAARCSLISRQMTRVANDRIRSKAPHFPFLHNAPIARYFEVDLLLADTDRNIADFHLGSEQTGKVL